MEGLGVFGYRESESEETIWPNMSDDRYNYEGVKAYTMI